MSEKTNPKNWGKELSEVRELCAVPGMTISRLLRNLESHLPADHYTGAKNEINSRILKTLGWRTYANGAGVYRLVTNGNYYQYALANVNNEMSVPSVADIVNESMQAVVELGSGFGRNLFDLRDLLEHKFPNVRYFDCELSDTGLASSKAIAALEPDRDNISLSKSGPMLQLTSLVR